MPLSHEVENDVRCLIGASGWIEKQKFDKLHEIVIRLQLSSIKEAIGENPDSVDLPDTMGSTPLLRAAAGGPSRLDTPCSQRRSYGYVSCPHLSHMLPIGAKH